MKRLSVFVVLVLLCSLLPNGVQQNVQAASFNYGEALQKSILFYEAQRSGAISTSGIPTRLTWRGDSQLTDGQKEGLDLTGGWVDAGDNVKFNITAGYSATLLAMGGIEYKEAYEKSGQMKWLLNQLRWINDYFIKCHPEPNVFWAQVGMAADDHSNWIPIESTSVKNDRTAIKIDTTNPGTELAMDVASAMAASSVLFRSSDPTYADELLEHAVQLYEFGDKYRGKFSDTIKLVDPEGASCYTSWSGFDDELVWGSIWLYIGKEAQAKGSGNTYGDKAKTYYEKLGLEKDQKVKSYKWAHCWDNKSSGSYVIMAKLFPENESYRQDAERWLNFWSVGGTEHGADGTKVSYTPGGHARLDQWGSLRYASTTALFAFIYSDFTNDSAKKSRYYDFGVKQINYILGDNPRNSSYIVGFGENSPQHPHHRTAHSSWSGRMDVPAEHRHILYGALVGSPSTSDDFNDKISDYVSNEVAIDYNAGLTGALAKMYEDFGGSPIPDSEFPLPDKPYEPKDEWPIFGLTYSNGSNGTNFSLTVENRSAWPARPTDKLKIRYFLTLDTNDISDITIKPPEGVKVTGPELWDATKKVYYVTLDFDGMMIYPGFAWERGGPEVNFTIGSKSNQWDASNDWSFKDWDSTYVNGSRKYISNIPVYEGDSFVKLAGNEPEGGSANTPVPTNTSSPTPAPVVKYGDINGDGNVNSIDFGYFRQLLLGIIKQVPNPKGDVVADLDGNGTVNSIDFAYFRQWLLGIIKVFPVEK